MEKKKIRVAVRDSSTKFGSRFVEMEGEPIELGYAGLSFFLVKDGTSVLPFLVVEPKTGVIVAKGSRRLLAIRSARHFVEAVGIDNIVERIDKILESLNLYEYESQQ